MHLKSLTVNHLLKVDSFLNYNSFQVGPRFVNINPLNVDKLMKQAEAEVVPSSSSVKAKLSLVKLLLELKLSFSSDF